MVTDPGETRADSTRQQILRAASRQFARKPYSLVSLDDILADAKVTKGAMYFHFRSKQALAMAIIEEQSSSTRALVDELVARKLSGLESLIDIAYLVAVQDITEDITRAGLDLLESIGRTDGFRAKLYEGSIRTFAQIVKRAIDEGDLAKHSDPEDVSRLFVSLYAGNRQIASLDQPEQFLDHLERAFVLCLPSFADPDRIDYFTQFIRRRTAVAKNKLSIGRDSA